MRAVIQRVTGATVSILGDEIAKIGRGLLILVGIGVGDTEIDIDYLVGKILALRVFQDDTRKMNLSVQDSCGELLVVSQFTLYADTSRGNRPSFVNAMPPASAQELYDIFIKKLRMVYPRVKTGVFGSDMQVTLCNDGPVTIIIDSKFR